MIGVGWSLRSRMDTEARSATVPAASSHTPQVQTSIDMQSQAGLQHMAASVKQQLKRIKPKRAERADSHPAADMGAS